MAIETLFISTLFLAIDVPEMLWTQHIENGIAKEITQLVDEAPPVAQVSRVDSPQVVSQPQVTTGLCGSCGYQNDPTASFCIKCGTKLKG